MDTIFYFHFFALYAGYNQKLDINPKLGSEPVGNCVAKLKRGKAAGLDGLTAEHVIYSNPVLLTHFNILFNIMLVYGMVPDAFGREIITPLVKNLDGDKTASDNYRSITLSPVISKLFELVLMELFGDQLCTDKLQFGFKSKSSCSHAIFVMRTVIMLNQLQQSQSQHSIFLRPLTELTIMHCSVYW